MVINWKRLIFVFFWIIIYAIVIYYGIRGFNLSNSVTTTLSFFRIAGLLSFTTLAFQISTGAFRPLLNKIFNPAKIYNFHIAVGRIAFLLVLTHPILFIIANYMAKTLDFSYFIPLYITNDFYRTALSFGPTALYLLFLSVGAAVLRKKIKNWIWFHRLNFIIFILVFIHSFNVGTDLAKYAFLKAIWILLFIIVIFGLLYKIKLMIKNRKRTKVESPISFYTKLLFNELWQK